MARLSGKTAFVTGAGSIGSGWSNGKAAAVLFAREGARVFAVDRNADAAHEVADLIADDGGECIPHVADVSRADEVESAIGRCVALFGGLDVLHNNVGVGVVGGTLDADEHTWDLVHRINLKSMFFTIRHAIPFMLENGGGAIVNISSIASIRWTGTPYLSYSVSKAGVNQLTRSVALEYAQHGIRCNAVLPGFIDTPTVYAGLAKDGDADHLRRTRAATCPSGEMGEPWDVAHASLFLASDEARYITGALLPVDGGLSLQISSPDAEG